MQVRQAVYDLAPVIADVISAHCRGTSARRIFIRACFLGDWEEAKSMVEGMLAEPWVLRGYQEARLCEFLGLLPVTAPGTPETIRKLESGVKLPTVRGCPADLKRRKNETVGWGTRIRT